MDTAGEIGVRPLRERRLLLEVLLHLREILLLQEVVETLISRLEVVKRIVIVHRGFNACALRLRFANLRLSVGAAVTRRLRAALRDRCCASLLQCRQATQSGLAHCLWTADHVAELPRPRSLGPRVHYQTFFRSIL